MTNRILVRTDELARWLGGLSLADAITMRAALELAVSHSASLIAVDAAEPTLLPRLGHRTVDLHARVREATSWLGLMINCLEDRR